MGLFVKGSLFSRGIQCVCIFFVSVVVVTHWSGTETAPALAPWADPAKGLGGVEGADRPAWSENFLLYGYDLEPYPLDPGPHLFIDWRYMLPGRTSYYFADGAEAPRYDGDPARLGEIWGREDQTPYGIRLETQPAEKTGIVLPNDQPWEYCLAYHTLLHDNGKYRLWYEAIAPRDTGIEGQLCLAESEDGLHWVKPDLGIVEFKESKANNIVYGPAISGHSFHGSSVFIDPTAPPEARYRLAYMCGGTEQEIADLKARSPKSVDPYGETKKLLIRTAFSPDGIHWTPSPEPLLAHMSDTQTTLYYDTILKRYVGFFRMAHMNHRAIGRCESTEMKDWPMPEVCLWPNPFDGPFDDYYINGYTLYPGTRSMHFMLSTIFRRDLDVTNIRVASSMDGRTWEWLPGGPVVEPGKEGTWDGGCLFGGINLVELPGDLVAIPYVGYAYPHKFPRYDPHLGNIGLATWTKERLVALVADEEGEFWTTPLKAKGERLYLNYEAPRNGYVKVEIQGGDGRKLENCDLLTGNQVRKEVTWKGASGIGVKPGESFTLHIKMKAAKLYSFELR